jgi:hypothetical protein
MSDKIVRFTYIQKVNYELTYEEFITYVKDDKIMADKIWNNFLEATHFEKKEVEDVEHCNLDFPEWIIEEISNAQEEIEEREAETCKNCNHKIYNRKHISINDKNIIGCKLE